MTVEKKKLVRERNEAQAKAKHQQATIDEFVVSREGIKRIRLEAEAERDKWRKAQEQASIAESAQKTQQLVDKFEQEIQEMQRKHDKALQDKMNEHFLHTVKLKNEVR